MRLYLVCLGFRPFSPRSHCLKSGEHYETCAALEAVQGVRKTELKRRRERLEQTRKLCSSPLLLESLLVLPERISSLYVHLCASVLGWNLVPCTR